MADIVAFLESLTDSNFDRTIPERVPSGLPPGGFIAGHGAFAEFEIVQHFCGEAVAEAGDGAARTAIYKTVKNLRVHAGHQHEVIIVAGDVLGSIAEGIRPAKFLEANEV